MTLARIAVLAFAILTGGCATTGEQEQSGADEPGITTEDTAAVDGETVEPDVVSHPEYRDPLIHVNRAIFTFNEVSFRYVLIPLSKGYLWAVPRPVRRSIGNFFYNLRTPIYFVNHLLQLKPKPMGQNLLRFGINTTIGLLGFFDPAKTWFNIERQETHFEDTLADYGSGYGIYLVLPFFGPSDLRNGASTIADYFLDPVRYLANNPERAAIQAFDHFQGFAPGAERFETLHEEADDPYLFFRNMYLQGVQRDAAQ